MKIGIWCAYSETLTPNAGIGVFVHNLARGLAKLAEVENIVLAIHAGDESLVGETLSIGEGNISTAAVKKLPWLARFKSKRLMKRQRRICDRIAAGENSQSNLIRRDKNEAHLDQLFSSQRVNMPPKIDSCDVWILPHVAVYRRFDSPTIPIVHDMVPLHFHDVIKKKKLESFRRHCQRLVDHATLVGTMSKTIQDIDIVGLLGCPPEKVRIVTGAIPTNFGKPLSRDELLRQFPVAGRPYILYPAGYRSYKNHGVLIEALAQLHAEGHPDLDLVFTGFTGMPNELARQIASVNLSGRVHAVGVVKRSELAGLYQQAAVTVVPSLYEQGSYPIVEAIHWGCPAACSGIAALREYLEPLDNTVPFFDPRSAAELCRVVIGVLSDRTNTVSIQQAALKHMSKRTWQVVAEDWRNVLLEAIQRSGRDNSV